MAEIKERFRGFEEEMIINGPEGTRFVRTVIISNQHTWNWLMEGDAPGRKILEKIDLIHLTPDELMPEKFLYPGTKEQNKRLTDLERIEELYSKLLNAIVIHVVVLDNFLLGIKETTREDHSVEFHDENAIVKLVRWYERYEENAERYNRLRARGHRHILVLVTSDEPRPDDLRHLMELKEGKAGKGVLDRIYLMGSRLNLAEDKVYHSRYVWDWAVSGLISRLVFCPPPPSTPPLFYAWRNFWMEFEENEDSGRVEGVIKKEIEGRFEKKKVKGLSFSTPQASTRIDDVIGKVIQFELEKVDWLDASKRMNLDWDGLEERILEKVKEKSKDSVARGLSEVRYFCENLIERFFRDPGFSNLEIVEGPVSEIPDVKFWKWKNSLWRYRDLIENAGNLLQEIKKGLTPFLYRVLLGFGSAFFVGLVFSLILVRFLNGWNEIILLVSGGAVVGGVVGPIVMYLKEKKSAKNALRIYQEEIIGKFSDIVGGVFRELEKGVKEGKIRRLKDIYDKLIGYLGWLFSIYYKWLINELAKFKLINDKSGDVETGIKDLSNQFGEERMERFLRQRRNFKEETLLRVKGFQLYDENWRESIKLEIDKNWEEWRENWEFFCRREGNEATGYLPQKLMLKEFNRFLEKMALDAIEWCLRRNRGMKEEIENGVVQKFREIQEQGFSYSMSIYFEKQFSDDKNVFIFLRNGLDVSIEQETIIKIPVGSPAFIGMVYEEARIASEKDNEIPEIILRRNN